MPEGDTIHRLAGRMAAAMEGHEIDLADAPNPRSPIHHRAAELTGRRLERVEARGKNLLAHFSGGLAVHSHLGVGGRMRISADGRLPRGQPWLLLRSGRAVAAQWGGQILRVVSESRARNDPALLRLGPDPLAPDFDLQDAASRLRSMGAGREVGDAILDQQIIAGVGNAIRVEALFRARLSPWRPVDTLEPEEAERLLHECRRVMLATVERGRRPRSIYRGTLRPCPRCGGRILSRGQGDANRTAYWCEGCQA